MTVRLGIVEDEEGRSECEGQCRKGTQGQQSLSSDGGAGGLITVSRVDASTRKQLRASADGMSAATQSTSSFHTSRG